MSVEAPAVDTRVLVIPPSPQSVPTPLLIPPPPKRRLFLSQQRVRDSDAHSAAVLIGASPPPSLRVVYINARGLFSRHSELVSWAIEHSLDAVEVSETWLLEHHVLEAPLGWKWIHTSPLPAGSPPSGGVAFLLGPTLSSKLSEVHSSSKSHSFELWVKGCGLLLGVLYLRPHASRDIAVSFFSSVASRLNSGSRSDGVVFSLAGGDLNARSGVRFSSDAFVDTVGRVLTEVVDEEALTVCNSLSKSGRRPKCRRAPGPTRHAAPHCRDWRRAPRSLRLRSR